MNRRNKLIILIVLILIVLLLLAIFLWSSFRPSEELPEPVQPEFPTTEAVIDTTPVEPITVSEERAERARTGSLQALAKLFAERYGSFSSEASGQNLRDLMPLMTEGFAARTAEQIAAIKTSPDYYGVTTRVVSVTVEDMDEALGSARVRVDTQREEARGTLQDTSVRYQTVILSFALVDGSWLVDGATWE
jgi:hypothetical protein